MQLFYFFYFNDTSMIKWNAVIFSLIFIICHACTDQSKVEYNEDGERVWNVISSSGKVYRFFNEKRPNSTKYDIVVKTEKFDKYNASHRFEYTDKIDTSYLADIDSNGFEELYIITLSDDFRKERTLYGMSSNLDKGASAIITPLAPYKQQANSALYKHFEGNNSFDISSNTIVEKYPITGKTNDRGDALTRGVVHFRLQVIENEWKLVPTTQYYEKG